MTKSHVSVSGVLRRADEVVLWVAGRTRRSLTGDKSPREIQLQIHDLLIEAEAAAFTSASRPRGSFFVCAGRTPFSSVAETGRWRSNQQAGGYLGQSTAEVVFGTPELGWAVLVGGPLPPSSASDDGRVYGDRLPEAVIEVGGCWFGIFDGGAPPSEQLI